MTSTIPTIDLTADDALENLPELIHNGSNSNPESDDSQMESVDPSHAICIAKYEEVKDSSCLSGCNVIMPSEDILFSQYLRSRSPSLSIKGEDDDNYKRTTPTTNDQVGCRLFTPEGISLPDLSTGGLERRQSARIKAENHISSFDFANQTQASSPKFCFD